MLLCATPRPVACHGSARDRAAKCGVLCCPSSSSDAACHVGRREIVVALCLCRGVQMFVCTIQSDRSMLWRAITHVMHRWEPAAKCRARTCLLRTRSKPMAPVSSYRPCERQTERALCDVDTQPLFPKTRRVQCKCVERNLSANVRRVESA